MSNIKFNNYHEDDLQVAFTRTLNSIQLDKKKIMDLISIAGNHSDIHKNLKEIKGDYLSINSDDNDKLKDINILNNSVNNTNINEYDINIITDITKKNKNISTNNSNNVTLNEHKKYNQNNEVKSKYENKPFKMIRKKSKKKKKNKRKSDKSKTYNSKYSNLIIKNEIYKKHDNKIKNNSSINKIKYSSNKINHSKYIDDSSDSDSLNLARKLFYDEENEIKENNESIVKEYNHDFLGYSPDINKKIIIINKKEKKSSKDEIKFINKERNFDRWMEFTVANINNPKKIRKKIDSCEGLIFE